jgi:hypothetical protein
MDITPVHGIVPDTTEARGAITTVRGEATAAPTTTVGGAAAIGGGNRPKSPGSPSRFFRCVKLSSTPSSENSRPTPDCHRGRDDRRCSAASAAT